MSSKLNRIIALAFTTLFVNSASAEQVPEPISFMVNQFSVEGDSPIPVSQTDAILAPFSGKKYGLADLQAVSKELETVMRDAGYSFYRVVLPPQNVADGHVSFNVVAFTLGEIKLKGNQYFGDANILNSLPHLQLDQSPNTQRLAQQIKVANKHPNKNASVIFKQSKEADKIIAEVEATDAKPYQFSLLANNTGSKETGKARVTAAFQYNNLWNKDHRINVSYTTSPNHSRDVQQYAASYAAPLYQTSGLLTAYYTYSDVETGRVPITGGDLDVSGSGEMFGIRYLQYLPKIERYEHSLDIAFDNRLFNNTVNLNIGTTDLGDISPDIRSTPLSLTYKGSMAFDSISIGHHISWSKNLEIGSLNDEQAYQDMAFSTGQTLSENWNLFRYGAFANKTIKKWLLRANLKGQYSNESLISGEQFGLGGAYSVRGYKEREIGADTGNSISFEVYTPKWHNINLLAFYDYGRAHNQDTQAGIEQDWTLASMGIGLRWQYKTYLQASVDVGHTLKDGTQTGRHENKVHASIAIVY